MNKKNQAVQLVWRNLSLRCFALFFCSPFFLYAQSSCLLLSQNDLMDISPSVTEITKKVSSFFETSGEEDISSYFHPRLKITPKKLEALYLIEKYKIGKKIKASLFRSWKVMSFEERAEDIYCPKDGIKLLTHYGYPYQLGFWMNLMGEKDQSVLYFSLVPKDKKFYIGAFHIVKWSHLKKTYRMWTKDALEDLKEQKPFLAYLKLDIAKKLTMGDPFFTVDATEEIKKIQKKVLSEEDNLKFYQKALKGFDLKSVVSVFNSGGIGLKFAFQGDLKISKDDFRKDCKRIESLLVKTELYSEVSGIRCDLLSPELPLRALGSFYLERGQKIL